MSQALKSDNMENYLRSIRKLHLAPVQGLRWQACTKQSILLLILDYRARQQSDDLSRCCWYSFLVTGLTAFSSGSVIAWSRVWCSLSQLSRGKPQQSVMEELLRGDVRSQAAADVASCIRVSSLHCDKRCETHECVCLHVCVQVFLGDWFTVRVFQRLLFLAWQLSDTSLHIAQGSASDSDL